MKEDWTEKKRRKHKISSSFYHLFFFNDFRSLTRSVGSLNQGLFERKKVKEQEKEQKIDAAAC